MTFRPEHLYFGILDVGLHPERNSVQQERNYEPSKMTQNHTPPDVKMAGLLPAEPQRWLSDTWTVCCRWAGGRQMRKSSEASASPHKPAKQRNYNECHQD